MTKYLYGASVQGIQEFIFKTNKLKEIVGASEIVEEICTSLFIDQIGKENYKESNLIIGAAGNIKYVFDNQDLCKKLVLEFPKKVMEKVPGITISQAIVCFEDEHFNIANCKLVERLKEQRNKITMPVEIGFMGLERARRTGGVAFTNENIEKEIIDEATDIKNKVTSTNLFSKLIGNTHPNEYETTLNIEDITRGNKNKWIAVIHADGNGLGSLVQELSEKLSSKDNQTQIYTFRDFSKNLDIATQIAAQKAFYEVCKNEKRNKKYPIRPVVMGGDDITLIIRGDLALKFTTIFIREFEKQCDEKLKFLKNYIGDKYKLTACAGIAYIKESYPFHYGVHLADKLCQEAKHFSKDKTKFITEVPPSSLSFLKVKDSFIENDIAKIRKRTQETPFGVNYHFGPYLINKDERYPSVDIIQKSLSILEEEISRVENKKTKAVSKLRQLVDESFSNKESSVFMQTRMFDPKINGKFMNALKVLGNKFPYEQEKSSIYDVIQLHTLKY